MYEVLGRAESLLKDKTKTTFYLIKKNSIQHSIYVWIKNKLKCFVMTVVHTSCLFWAWHYFLSMYVTSPIIPYLFPFYVSLISAAAMLMQACPQSHALYSASHCLCHLPYGPVRCTHTHTHARTHARTHTHTHTHTHTLFFWFIFQTKLLLFLSEWLSSCCSFVFSVFLNASDAGQ